MKQRLGIIELDDTRWRKCLEDETFHKELLDSFKGFLILDVKRGAGCSLYMGIWHCFDIVETINSSGVLKIPYYDIDFDQLPPGVTKTAQLIEWSIGQLHGDPVPFRSQRKTTRSDIIDIIIPTLKPYEECIDQINEIEQNTRIPHRLIVTCQNESAAVNRNFGLSFANSSEVIMCDDDMTGFFPGWAEKLVDHLHIDPLLCMVSARLKNPDGTIPRTCANNTDTSKDLIYVQKTRDSVMASACIAFINKGLKFDERYIGSGWEDTDYCFQYNVRNPNYKFAIANDCQLIHINEMKRQYEKQDGQTFFQINKAKFYQKWRIR